MAKIKYVGTVDTPVNAGQLDDLAGHLGRVSHLHGLDLAGIEVDMGGEITQISFEAEVA